MRSFVKIVLLNALLIIMASCAIKNKLEPVVNFETTYGDFTVKLYAETPKHRDNFK